MPRVTLPDRNAVAALVTRDGLLALRVTPNAKSEALTIEGAALKARVTVAPEGGKANKAVIALVAKALGRPPSALTIVRGETARDKLIRLSA